MHASIKKIALVLILASVLGVTPLFLTRSPLVRAADTPPPGQDSYYPATVTAITAEGVKDIDGTAHPYQTVELEINNGPEQGRYITVDHGGIFVIEESQKVHTGEQVIVSKPDAPGGKADFYYITDKYRLPKVGILVALFLCLATLCGRRRGLTSLLGLGVSLLIIFGFIIPRITGGANPLLVCVIGALIITITTLYLAHGFNKRTTIALIGTLICLFLAAAFDLLFVKIAGLTGTGTEEAFYLQFDNATLNLRGILLGGIILGVLGVLDDVTTGQTAAVDEIYKANPTLGFGELYRRGLSVGREHIASLINTLVLAYVGASFPLLLLFSTQKNQAWWLTLNSTFLSEEIVRTLVGSSVLVIAVPITTALSAYWLSRPDNKITTEPVISAPPSFSERTDLLRNLYSDRK